MNIGRLKSNGTVDSIFDPEVDGRIAALALQSNGMILVGGEFTHIDGHLHMYLGRLNPGGSLDDGFTADLNSSSYVKTITVQPDGRILVGGLFSQLGGVN